MHEFECLYHLHVALQEVAFDMHDSGVDTLISPNLVGACHAAASGTLCCLWSPYFVQLLNMMDAARALIC